jgi:hypothetical protein
MVLRRGIFSFSFTILSPLPGVKEIGSDPPRDLERRLRFTARNRAASIAIHRDPAFFIASVAARSLPSLFLFFFFIRL